MQYLDCRLWVVADGHSQLPHPEPLAPVVHHHLCSWSYIRSLLGDEQVDQVFEGGTKPPAAYRQVKALQGRSSARVDRQISSQAADSAQS